MSTRYEWFTAASVKVEYVRPGETVDGSDPVVGPFHDEMVAESGAVVISGDEATVLHGTPLELRDLARRILAVLPLPPTEQIVPMTRMDAALIGANMAIAASILDGSADRAKSLREDVKRLQRRRNGDLG